MASHTIAERPRTARDEWAGNWPVVSSSAIGISLSAAAIYTLGQFMEPLETAFGWTRTQTSVGVSISSFGTFILSAVLGRLVDKVNVRFLAIIGVLITSIALASFSLVGGDFRLWVGLWCLVALGTALIAPTIWLAGVMAVFKVDRSLPMAIALCGLGISSAVGPIAARTLIDLFGWQMAYPLLALLWGGITLLLTLFLFFDRRESGLGEAQEIAAQASPTSPMREILLSGLFLRFSVAIFAVMAMFTALMINLAPVLVGRGLSNGEAAAFAGLAGIGSISGKPVIGWLFDHVRSSVVTTGAMATLALACVLLQYAHWHAFAVLGSFALGAAAGATSTVMACVTVKIFKPQDFGTVYGSLTSVMSLGAMVGPALAGIIYDASNGYALLLWIGVAVAAFAALVMATLGGGVPVEE